MYEANKYQERIRIRKDHHAWLMDNYKKAGLKSAAALNEQILDEYIKPNLFKKRK